MSFVDQLLALVDTFVAGVLELVRELLFFLVGG